MGRDSERGVPIHTPPAGTNKIVMTRIEVADLLRPTTQMAPLFAEGTTDDSLVIEEFVPTYSGEHKALVSKDSLEGLEVIDLRMSGMVAIDERSVELSDELDAVSARVEKPVKPSTSDSTQPLSLSQDEVATMSAIARVNDAVISGALEPVATIDSSRVTAQLDAQAAESSPRERLATPPAVRAARTEELSPIDRVGRSTEQPVIAPGGSFGAAPLVPGAPIVPAASLAVEDAVTDTTLPNRDAATSLGVAPLEPATVVRAPFVIDTPVQRWSPIPRAQQTTPPAATNLVEGAAGSNRMPTVTTGSELPLRHERTAMIALDPSTGAARSSGPWQALAAVARSLRSVRWWLRRRKTSRVKPLDR